LEGRVEGVLKEKVPTAGFKRFKRFKRFREN